MDVTIIGGGQEDPISGDVLVLAVWFDAAKAALEQYGGQLAVFIAGDDERAKETVRELVRSSGLNPIDAGPLRRARELERLGFLHMAIQERLGTGYGSAVKVIT
jgi:predicted dinucleotide-binding enzyme